MLVFLLKTNEDDSNSNTPVKKKKKKTTPKHVDSNGDAPLDGQIHIDEYDFNKLEKELLYGEAYELSA